MLSRRLAALHRDACITDGQAETTVNLAAHRGESSLEDLELGMTVFGVLASSRKHRPTTWPRLLIPVESWWPAN